MVGTSIKESYEIPDILYHATNSTWDTPEIKGLGFHAGTLKAAQYRIRSFTMNINPHIKMVRLNIKHPLYIGRDYRFHNDLSKVSKELYKDGVISKDEKNIYSQVYSSATFENLRKLLQNKYGYDGIVYRNNIEDRGSLSYIAFFPEQIEILGEYVKESVDNPIEKTIEEYLEQVNLGDYKELTPKLYNDITEEGWLESLETEFETDYTIDDFEYLTLDLTESDKIGLKNTTEEALEKFNDFDVLLKEQGEYPFDTIDMIDYNKGIVYIIRLI